MDDLMRRAAAEYPVKPQGADWEKVAQQLGASNSGVAAKKSYGLLKKLLCLLPLLLAGFVCDRFFVYKYGELKNQQPVGIINPVRSDSQRAVSNNKSRNIKAKVVKEKVSVYTTVKTVSTSDKPTNKHTIREMVEESMVLKQTDLPQDKDIFKNSVRKETTESVVPFPEIPLQIAAMKKPEPLAVVEALQRIVISQNPIPKKPKAAPYEGLKKFYVSVLAGPDASRVKAQKKEHLGYTLGLVAGFNFSKKWAVEAGLLWDKKAYFSKGDYFKNDKIYLPPHSKIVQVSGDCAMFEIPVNIRYNALRTRNSILFASAGASSYLMQKEDYDYVYRRYNQEYAGSKVYKKASQNWVSVGNVSVGYEQRILKRTSLRVEPYIRIPLKGVGIGSLPLRSTGILVGLTRTIQY